MAFRLLFIETYTRSALRWLKKYPDLKSEYLRTLKLLEANPFHPSLRLNALAGRLQGLHSVSINLSYRITLELIVRDGDIVLIKVGDHDQVY